MKKVFCILCTIVLVFSFILPACAIKGEYKKLKEGSSGDRVYKLQVRMKELGYYRYKPDSKFGARLTEAIQYFQKRNGLTPDGIATPELQEMIYDEDAETVYIDLGIVPVQISLDIYNDKLGVAIRNYTDEDIDSVYCVMLMLGKDGEILANKSLTSEKNYLRYIWGLEDAVIQAGDTQRWYIEESGAPCSVASKVALAVRRYHTKSGNYVEIPTESMAWYYSDKTYELPIEDIQLYTCSGKDMLRYDDYSCGVDDAVYVYPWTAEAYGAAEGLQLVSVETGSLFDKAGFRANDTLTAIEGIPAYSMKAICTLKEQLLSKNSVEISYLRDGKEYTVTVSEGMTSAAPAEKTVTEQTVTESSSAANSSAGSDSSVSGDAGERLMKYAEMLANGLITREEFDILKNALLGK